MPNPKEKKNAPANAATDTGTGSAQKMYKKLTPRPQGNGGTVGTHGQMKRIAEPLRKSAQEGALEGAATAGGILSHRRTATPRTETIGRAQATPINQSNTTRPGHTNRPADPFLQGFNSDDVSQVRNRNHGGNRRQKK